MSQSRNKPSQNSGNRRRNDLGVAHASVVVLVQQPLVVWVLKVALRGGAHVVGAEIRVVNQRESVIAVVRNISQHFRQVRSVFYFRHRLQAGSQDHSVSHHTQDLQSEHFD